MEKGMEEKSMILKDVGAAGRAFVLTFPRLYQ